MDRTHKHGAMFVCICISVEQYVCSVEPRVEKKEVYSKRPSIIMSEL